MSALLLLIGCMDLGRHVSTVPIERDTATTETADTGSDDSGSPPVEEVVVMVANAFDPATVTIRAGDTITWVNEDAWFHIVASGEPGDAQNEWMSPTLEHGEQWSLVFDDPGEHIYFCWNHAAIMRDALVIVEAR